MKNLENKIYEEIIFKTKSILKNFCDPIANLSNISSALFEMGNVNWSGFYIFKNNSLILGPFQGLIACSEIQVTEGVCGYAFSNNKTTLVENVHDFDGHIACDSRSNSEIVVPINYKGKPVILIDIDSESIGRFKEEEKIFVEEIRNLIEEYLDFESLFAKDFNKVIINRQSCRDFKDLEIEDEKIKKILDLSLISPSACNAQAYKIYVAKNSSADIIKKSRSLFQNKFIEKANTFILICEDNYNILSKFGSSYYKTDFRAIDIGILSQSICLSAESLNIKSCILGSFDEKKVRKLFDIKEKISLIIALGYSDNKLREKQRKDFDKIVKFL